ncbi:hypothetical protein BBK82_25325 [Lentzea guizhouensis]|uniref:Uncharacterized protein n=1 Tax=Lentzea guizhouensis TaxID=1586287 RepID=A0A1B2HMF3_9PSEU|nr:hypothetical protein [Lentzea guizhouensis]ANZ38899.1 hypothetical protein BBK82_25325 [Lentzea guizhouensis]
MTVSNASMLDQWEQVIDFVEDSYHDNIDEYMYDLSVREAIERRLSEGAEPPWVAERLAELDARFRALLLPEPVRDDVPWWKAHVPAYAGAELAASLHEWYGVTIEVR